MTIMSAPAALSEHESPDGIEHLRDRLLRISGVRDAAVRIRIDEMGTPAIVAYLVVDAAPSRTLIDKATAGLGGAVGTVTLSDLPYDGEGQIDELRLATYPVVDAGLLARDGMKHHVLELLSWNEAETVIVHASGSSRLDGPDLPPDPAERSCLTDMLVHAARTFDTGLVFINPGALDRTLSYAGLEDHALRIAGGLRGVGYGAGSIVLLQLADPANFLAVFWGALSAGIIPVMLGVPGRHVADDQVAHRLADAASLFPGAVVVCERRLKGAIDTFLSGRSSLAVEDLMLAPHADGHYRASGNETAIFLLTSGSTSKPKAVPQTHDNLIAHCLGAKIAHDLKEDEVSLNWLPLDHVGGIVMCHLRELFHGFDQHHASSTAFLQDPLRWLDWMSERKITVGWAPDFAFNLVCTEIEKHGPRNWDLSRMRFITNGGEAVVRSHAETFLRRLAPFGLRPETMRPAWGMSETCGDSIICRQFHADMAAEITGPVSVGKPYPGLSLRIVDASGNIVPQGTIGRLNIRGALVLPSYFDNGNANAAAFSEDGWFDTGDLGAISRDRLYMMGRAKDLIIVNGQNIDPAAVEAQVDAIVGVRPSFTGVVSRRDSRDDSEQVSVFFVAENPEAQIEPLLQSIRGKISSVFGIQPSEIILLTEDDVPKTSIGKIQKEKLKARLDSGRLVPTYRRAPVARMDAEPALPQRLWRHVWRKRRAQPGLPPERIMLVGNGGRAHPLAIALTERDNRFCHAELSSLAMEDTAKARRHVVTIADADFDIADVLAVIQVLAKTSVRLPCQLLVVGPEAAGDLLAPVAPLLRTAMDEIPGLGARLVLTDTFDTGLADILLAEAADCGREAEVVHRAGHRLVSRLAPTLPSGDGNGIKLRRSGVYLVTGGLGGIGRLLCDHLVTKYAAHLIITGRRECHALDADAAEALAMLAARTSVAYIVANSEDPLSIDALAEAVATRTGGQLDGIFHLAGEALDASIGEISAGALRRAIANRRNAIGAMEDVATRLGAKFVVQFSSVNGYFGGAGVGAYAAGCRQQMVAAEKPAAAGMPLSRCINWSAWQNTGMSKGYGLAALSERKGFRSLAVPAALAAFEASLASADAVVFAGIDETRLAMHRETVAEPVALDQLDTGTADIAALQLTDRFGTMVPLVRSVATTTGESMTTAAAAESTFIDGLTATLSKIWQDTLDLDFLPKPADNIFDLGGQSLLMPRLQNAIQSSLGVEIDLLDLFDHITLGALSSFVGGKLDGKSN